MLTQSSINLMSDVCTKLFAAVEKSVLLPGNMEQSDCEFEHNLTSNSAGHFYVVTITERGQPRSKQGWSYTNKLESTGMLELFTLIASFYEFDLAKTLE